MYDPSRNPKWSCTYHPGCYGIAGPIKRGLGWTCCGREKNEKGCCNGAHTNEFKTPRSLRDDLDDFMALCHKYRSTRSRSLPDLQRNSAHHYILTAMLEMDLEAFDSAVFCAAVGRAANIGVECVTILSVKAGSVIAAFMFEGLPDEKATVDKFLAIVKAQGLKGIAVKDITVRPPEPAKTKPEPRRAMTPPPRKPLAPSAANSSPNPRTVATNPAAKGKITRLAQPQPSAKATASSRPASKK
uniref:Uncharacterized protein n=1 Tax=Eutreptiella gymnastica TaxID=73025 RepID=A0A7S1I732_9EUGL